MQNNKTTTPLTLSRSIIIYLLFFLLIGAVYSPVLYFDYLYHDDTSFWIKFKELGFKHFFFDTCVSQCRYGNAILLTMENFFVHKVSDLKILRFLSIMISSGTAFLLFKQMRRLSFSNIQAFLTVSIIFLFPGFANIITNASYSSSFSLCILISCLSFHIMEKRKRVTIPIILFLFAISIYPPCAMFYWVMIGMNILFVQERYSADFRDFIFRSVAAGLTSLMLYAISISAIHQFFLHKMNSPSYNPYETASNCIQKLHWFIQEPLRNALNLWSIYPKKNISILVSIFITFTFLITMINKLNHIEPKDKKNVILTWFWQIGLLAFVLLLSFLPNLAAKENVAFYRCLIPLTSLIWLVLIWSIYQWKLILPMILTRWNLIALLSLLVIAGGLTAFRNVLHFRVLPSYVEWMAYKHMAEEIRSKKVDAIDVVLPLHPPFQRYDEFGTLTSDYIFNIYPLIFCAFNEVEKIDVKSMPLLYVLYPGTPDLISVKEILFTKLPDGKWVGRDIYKDKLFDEYDHSALGDTLDQQLVCSQSYNQRSLKKLHWYFLDLKDLFDPSNYIDLTRQF